LLRNLRKWRSALWISFVDFTTFRIESAFANDLKGNNMNSPSTSDELLASKAQQGDREAFLTLYNRYLNKVFNRVRTRIPVADVEDVVQDIFIAVVRSLPNFEQRSQFNTWVYTIVNRQVADYYRKHRQAMSREEEATTLDDVDRRRARETNEHEAVDLKAQIQRALVKLPEHYQEIINLRFIDQLSFQEIALKRAQSVEAVKSLYRRALQAIRSEIGELDK
jgi:RNA polymerase sigma-70 factor (ECF subfamily)